jgi:hypothetical protein
LSNHRPSQPQGVYFLIEGNQAARIYTSLIDLEKPECNFDDCPTGIAFLLESMILLLYKML